jgi:hypothetical protein
VGSTADGAAPGSSLGVREPHSARNLDEPQIQKQPISWFRRVAQPALPAWSLTLNPACLNTCGDRTGHTTVGCAGAR